MLFVIKHKYIPLHILLCYLWIYSCPVSAQPHWQQESYISSSFLEIALKHEYPSNKKSNFSRWKRPLKIFIKSELGSADLQRRLYSVQAAHLQSITGHPIYFVESEAQANVIVVFTSAANMKADILKHIKIKNLDEILKTAFCLANYQINSKQEIIGGLIVIPVDKTRQDGRLVECVVEELTQLMGLPNDSELVYPSIFNDRSIDSYLTGLDYLLLKIAYHPKLKPGMTDSQVRVQLPAILKQLRSHNEIKQAQQRVLHNSMKSWVGE
ncbi:DUF2927 domain-containing protein [Psychromonas aquimarina]|uniref:DUF2927 domain-containing protein n=1 Tax=Psychromonas aquimarina TaxID=444919 RepID=UPI0003FBB0FB|nr:DUF2927 domain-containing protein [Psychromonas aquimarina]